MVKEHIEQRLFLQMFKINRDNKLRKQLSEETKKGTINYYCKLLGDVCSTPTKYNFLNKLILLGVLKPYGKLEWTGVAKNSIQYRIDAEQLYQVAIVKNSPGKDWYKAIDDFNLIPPRLFG